MYLNEYTSLEIDTAQRNKIFKKHNLKIIDSLIESGFTPYRPYFRNITALRLLKETVLLKVLYIAKMI